MYQHPKAIHFDAWLNDGPLLSKLHADDPVGRSYRWAAARAIERDVCNDMLRATPGTMHKIRRRLQQANVGRKVLVCLAGECPTCCGTGVIDSGESREDGAWIMIECECVPRTGD